MSPVYLNPPPSSPITFIEFKGDLVANNNFNSYTSLDKMSSHPTSDHDQGLSLDYSWNPHGNKVDKVLSYDHNSNDVGKSSSWPQNYMMDGSGCSYGHSSNPSGGHGKIKIVTNNEQKNSKKWKPSKVRIMQKMLTSSKTMGDHKVQHDPERRRYQSNLYKNNNSNNNININNNNGIRVCVDCHTTTTPLWRSGPQGPKTLCNACGIRQRKARRAAMAAAAATELANDGVIVSSPSSVSMEAPKPNKVHDQEARDTGLHHGGNHHPLPLKKRGKVTFEDATPPMNTNSNNDNNNNNYNYSWNSYFEAKSQRAFPRDEEEGAILLMALSCGSACSS